MTPKNKIATDEQIISALKKHGSRAEAASALRMAPKTLSNRVSMIKSNGVHKPKPVTRPSNFKSAQKGSVRRYVVTCAMSNAPVHKDFYDCLSIFCKEENAELVVIPQEYNWQDHLIGKQAAIYDKLIEDKLNTKDVKVNNNCVIKASYPLHATLVNPLQGLSMASPEKSCIFGHPSRSFKTVPTAQDKYPLLHYTSGAVTRPKYTRSKTGQKSRDMHRLGAIFVEANNQEFHCHELNYSEANRNVQMLDKVYSAMGVRTSKVTALVMGDEHVAQFDSEVINALYRNKGCLVDVLDPEYVVRHDVYDHSADSHHTRKNTVDRFIRRMSGANDVESELNLTVQHIDETTKNFTNVIVESNHNDHLDKWLNEFNVHSGDPINFPIYHYLNYLKFDGLKYGKDATAFELYCKEKMKCYDRVVWASRNKEFKINGTVVSNHGDISGNGAMGGKGLSMLGIDMVIGHCHSPYIDKLVYAVGAQMLKASYTKGYSGWLTTNCAMYPNGEKALVNVINGRWRL